LARVVDLGWVDGKRRRKYVAGATQSEALQKLRQAQRAAASGVVTDDRITVGAFLERWLTVNLPGSVAGGTLDDYADTVRLHLEPALGKKRLSGLTVADVDRVWASKRAAGYKPNTIRIMRSVLRKALAQAEREGFVTRNVVALSQPPRVAPPEGRSLSIEQAKTLLDAAKGNRLEVAYLVLLSYGLRRGELLGLAWADFDAQAGTLAVRQAVTTRKSSHRAGGEHPGNREGRIELSALKTRRSRRVLLLTPGIIAALGEHGAASGTSRLQPASCGPIMA
jgi:integrase